MKYATALMGLISVKNMLDCFLPSDCESRMSLWFHPSTVFIHSENTVVYSMPLGSCASYCMSCAALVWAVLLLCRCLDSQTHSCTMYYIFGSPTGSWYYLLSCLLITVYFFPHLLNGHHH
jgi:hypothetical protein